MGDTNLMSRLITRSGNAMRMFLFNSALVMMIGIGLSGFNQVHWFSYVMPVIFTIAAIFGVCPGINLWKIVLKEK